LFLQHIVNWLENGQTGNTTQKKIGMKQLFREYIVKEWFSENELETKYTAINEMFASRCVILYKE